MRCEKTSHKHASIEKISVPSVPRVPKQRKEGLIKHYKRKKGKKRG